MIYTSDGSHSSVEIHRINQSDIFSKEKKIKDKKVPKIGNLTQSDIRQKNLMSQTKE